jgi:serine/threonine protein kinase
MSRILDTRDQSSCFAAPEADGGSVQGDMWSLGVLLFAMVTGSVPWKSMRGQRLMKDTPFDIPARVSQSCADLIRQLVVIDPAVRLSADAALNHNFLTEQPQAGASEKPQHQSNSDESRQPQTNIAKSIDRVGSTTRKAASRSSTASSRRVPAPLGVIISHQPKIVVPTPVHRF